MKTKKEDVLEVFETHVEEWKERYRKAQTFYSFNFLTRRRWVLELLGPGNGKVLDVGCGTGDYIADLLEMGYDAYGTDNAVGMIASCRQRWGNHRFFVGDIESLSISGDSFDAAIVVGVVQYLKEDGQALRELARILRPGGKIVITVPTLTSPFILLDYFLYGLCSLAARGWNRLGLYRLLRGHTRPAGRRFLNRYYIPGLLERRLKAAGFVCTDRAGCAFGSMFLLAQTPFFVGFSRWMEKFARSPLRVFGSTYIVCAEKQGQAVKVEEVTGQPAYTGETR